MDNVNHVLDLLFLFGGLAAILGYPLVFVVRDTAKKIQTARKKHNQPDLIDTVQQTIILGVVVLIVAALWAAPELLHRFAKYNLPKDPRFYRWCLAGIFLLGAAFLFGRDHGGRRWLYSSLFHIAVVLGGYWLDRWLGLLFLSAPILLSYYVTLYSVAVILLPAANPEDRFEKRMRFNALASYAWGIQSPMIVAGEHAWQTPETRIPGDFTWDFRDFPVPLIEGLKWRPGLVWTPAHQVTALGTGLKFSRVAGPGLVFTGKMERPDQIFDLRLQLRSHEIDVISKDGIPFKAIVFTAFRIDPEPWDHDLYDMLRRMNPILRGADRPSHTAGSFPYSPQRVQAAMSVTGTKAGDGNTIIYWDQWAVNVIEDQARKVISQKNLDELWRPAEDTRFANAMDIVAQEIREGAALTLRAAGILLVAGRVVNFHFDDRGEETKVDGISQQQLVTWGSEWERKRQEILSEAGAEAERTQLEARAFAEARLLKSIADGLHKTQEMHPQLPRYVIATRFLSALQDHLHKQPEGKAITDLDNTFKEWQSQFFPDSEE